ncbi:hypothetical protein [Streptomyces chartreusis]
MSTLHPSDPSPAWPPINGTVSFKLRTHQLILPVLLGLLAGTALLYGGLAFTAQPLTLSELAQCVTAAVVASVVVAFLYRRHGVSLTNDALILLGDRRRQIPWTDILRLEVQRSCGVSRLAIYTTDGRCTMLRAPISLFDGEFDQKAQAVVRQWQGSR